MWLVISHPKNSGRWPMQVKPLQPWWVQSAPKKLHVPQFQCKPGCKKVGHLGCNSLFPWTVHAVAMKKSTAKVRLGGKSKPHTGANTLGIPQITIKLRASSHNENLVFTLPCNPSPRVQLLWSLPEKTLASWAKRIINKCVLYIKHCRINTQKKKKKPQQVNIDVEHQIKPGLLLEDMSIYSVNLTRWSDPNYTLQVEEIEVIVALSSSLSFEAGLGVWCTTSIFTCWGFFFSFEC